MDILIGWQQYKTQFNGAQVTMELRPLTRGAYMAVAPLLEDPNPKKKDESMADYMARLTPEEKRRMNTDGYKLQEMIRQVGPEHVRNITGLTVNGQPPTFDQLADEVVLSWLVIDIMTRLAVISTLPDVDAKNSDGPSGTPRSEKGLPSVAVSPAGPPTHG